MFLLLMPTVALGLFVGNRPVVRISKTKFQILVDSLLVAPAAYDKKAYELSFNAGFTACIRKDHSYLESDAWEILKAYKERGLIVSAELDQVIPNETINVYRSSPGMAEVDERIVEGAPHKVMSYMDDDMIERLAI